MTTKTFSLVHSRNPIQRHQRAVGFTLIEMLAVIVLIGIVAAIVVRTIGNRVNEGKYKSGKLQVNSLVMKIEEYALSNGSPPSRLEDLVTKPGNAANWTGPYAKASDLKDPFGHSFQYKIPGEHGDFDLVFLGKDGQAGGDGFDKDVGNWE